LGLAIVRAVIESLGGRITLAGEPGQGTTVTLLVPQPLPAAAPTEAVPVPGG
jgi:signal transduction histidine kinase